MRSRQRQYYFITYYYYIVVFVLSPLRQNSRAKSNHRRSPRIRIGRIYDVCPQIVSETTLKIIWVGSRPNGSQSILVVILYGPVNGIRVFFFPVVILTSI